MGRAVADDDAVNRHASMIARLRAAFGRWPGIVNLGLLIGGLGLGQGSIFAVQTWLLTIGEYQLLAAFGTHYSFAVLGIILVDGGASNILARAVAGWTGDGKLEGVWLIFCETSAIRGVTAALIAGAAAGYVLGLVGDGFSRAYVLFALPGLLFWAANVVGILDGLRLSGISGMTGSAAYAVTALGLALAAHRPGETAGAILGGAFSLGYLVTVTAQWIALGRNGWHPRLQRLTRAGLLRSLRDGSVLLFQFFPGQITMRVQLVLSTLYLGAETTALFIYAKQIVTGMTQIIGFVLRIDFPGLVQRLAGSGDRFRTILKAQQTTLYCAVTFSFATAILFGVAATVPDFSLHRAATVMVSFAPTVLTLSLSMMVIQGLAALGAYTVIASTVAIGSAVWVAISYALVSLLGVYAFVLGEVVSQLTTCYFAYRYIRGL